MCIVSLISVLELFHVLWMCGKGRTEHFCKVGWAEFLNSFLQTDLFFLINSAHLICKASIDSTRFVSLRKKIAYIESSVHRKVGNGRVFVCFLSPKAVCKFILCYRV